MRTETTHPLEFWKSYTLASGTIYYFKIGQLEVWLKKQSTDLFVASNSLDEAERFGVYDELTEAPTDMDWKRWSFNADIESVQIAPVMLDRPIIVKTSDPLTIPPGGDAMFYMSIPAVLLLTIQINEKEYEIIRIPTQNLSNTWFGTTIEGEFCYAIKIPAERDVSLLESKANRFLCPFHVYNRSDESLPIERICVRAKYFSSYATQTCLWTNPVKVTFKELDQPSTLVYTKNPPHMEGELTLIRQAEETVEKSFLRRTFNFLTARNDIQ